MTLKKAASGIAIFPDLYDYPAISRCFVRVWGKQPEKNNQNRIGEVNVRVFV
jgi:hypothetical protein